MGVSTGCDIVDDLTCRREREKGKSRRCDSEIHAVGKTACNNSDRFFFLRLRTDRFDLSNPISLSSLKGKNK